MISEATQNGEKVFRSINVVLLVLLSLIFLIPFISIFMTSFLSQEEYLRRGIVLFPEKIDFGAYKMLLSRSDMIFSGYKMTLFRTIIGTALQVLVTCTMAYGISRSFLPGRKIIIGLMVGAMVVPLLLVPRFLLIKWLGLYNSPWAMIFPWLVNTQYVFLMKAFYHEIPSSLEESAFIDGANPLQIFIKIILPLTKASAFTIGLFYAVWQWNEWFDAAIFINDKTLLPIQNLLRDMIVSAEVSEYLSDSTIAVPPSDSLKGAMIVITTIPILCVYPFIQKHFVKGFMMGAVKG